MSVPARQGETDADRVWPGVAIGVAASLLLHVAGAAAMWGFGPSARRPDEHRPPAEQAKLPPPPPELGRIDADRAAIAWLGVLEDPTEAEAPVSEVEQAALTPAPGVEPQPEPQPQPEAQPEVAEDAPIREPAESEPEPEPVEQASPAEQTEAAEQPEPSESAQPEPVQEPSVGAPFDAPAGPAVMPEPAPESQAETQPEPEPTAEPTAQPSDLPDPEAETPQIMGPPMPDPSQLNPAPKPEPPSRQTRPTSEPKPGAPGAESDRESDASMRERAVEYNAELNQPLASKGLEIKTVRPEWSVLVRQSYNPLNPYVAVRFGADGKVKRVTFISEPDGRKGTGIEPVDGPLIDAIYRWTAKGARIDALDKNNPDDQIMVPIRILLTR